MNTISGVMLQQISELLLRADHDPDVRCIVLTGAGRAFCAGLDLQAQMAGPKGGLGNLGGGEAPFSGEFDLRSAPPVVLHNLDTPTICALNGGSAGYGLDLALGCDIRIAVENAKLNPGFAKRGILPESGGTWLLPAHGRLRQGRRDRVHRAHAHRRPKHSTSAWSTTSPARRSSPTGPPNWPRRSRPTHRWPFGRSSG
jgi:enoyl-CoA hydratase/carnithine racemase